MTAPTLQRPTTGAAHPARGLLAASAPTLAAHAALNGPLPAPTPGELITQVEAGGLTGRDTARAATWRTLVIAGAGRRPVLVADATDDEPAGGRHAVLLTHCPHLVLDGVQLAALAVGSTSAHLVVRPGEGERVARAALVERAGRDPVSVRVVVGGPSFPAGDESSVLAAVQGRRRLPRTRLRLITESAGGGRPTLVHDAETLAHLAMIARYGAGWFRRCGTTEEPGTFLATISGAVRVPGVVEAPCGTALRDLLAAAGGPSAPLSAVLIGGRRGGAWVPAPGALDAAMSRAGLARHGASPGAGGLAALAAASCGLAATAKLVAALATPSAVPCGPCMFALPTLACDLATLADVSDGAPSPAVAERVATAAEPVEGRAACRHQDGTVRLIASALTVFADDVHAHLGGGCLAG